MKRLFRFPISSDYLEKNPGCKLARLQDTSSAAEGLREGMTTRGRIGGWRESGVEWEYIFSLSVFARRELERPHTHTTSPGSTAKFKARITRISEIFYRTRPKDAAVVETVIYTYVYVHRDEITESEGLKS